MHRAPCCAPTPSADGRIACETWCAGRTGRHVGLDSYAFSWWDDSGIRTFRSPAASYGRMRSQPIQHAEVAAPDMSEPSDERSLVARACAGDTGALEALYHAHAGRVFALCLRMSGDQHGARELAQDVFVKAWEALPAFRGDAALGSWLHRIAVNVILMRARSDKRRTSRVMLGDDVDEGGIDGPTQGMDVEQRIDLERAIATLPPGARRVFVLHDVQGYRHEEIARLTGSAEGTLRAQLHRARKLLMQALGEEAIP